MAWTGNLLSIECLRGCKYSQIFMKPRASRERGNCSTRKFVDETRWLPIVFSRLNFSAAAFHRCSARVFPEKENKWIFSNCVQSCLPWDAEEFNAFFLTAACCRMRISYGRNVFAASVDPNYVSNRNEVQQENGNKIGFVSELISN